MVDCSRSSHHRRAQSKHNFRLSKDLDLASDPFDVPSGSFEDFRSEDDLFCTYMDMEKLERGGSGRSNLMNLHESNSFILENNVNAGEEGEKNSGSGGIMRPRHRHCNSMDNSTSLFNSSSNNSESIEAKKGMTPDKLAELWNLDPKRAKRK